MKSFLNLANAEKISKHKKNAIYVQEYKKIIGTTEAEAVIEKEKMREKFLKTDASV